MQLTDAILATILGDITATGRAFGAPTTFVMPITAVTNRGLATALADVTAAPGAMGTSTNVGSWTSLYRISDGRRVADSQQLAWAPGSADDFCTVVGVAWVDSGTPTTLRGFEMLPAPVLIANLAAQLSLVARLTVDPNGRWSASVEWDGA